MDRAPASLDPPAYRTGLISPETTLESTPQRNKGLTERPDSFPRPPPRASGLPLHPPSALSCTSPHAHPVHQQLFQRCGNPKKASRRRYPALLRRPTPPATTPWLQERFVPLRLALHPRPRPPQALWPAAGALWPLLAARFLQTPTTKAEPGRLAVGLPSQSTRVDTGGVRALMKPPCPSGARASTWGQQRGWASGQAVHPARGEHRTVWGWVPGRGRLRVPKSESHLIFVLVRNGYRVGKRWDEDRKGGQGH